MVVVRYYYQSLAYCDGALVEILPLVQRNNSVFPTVYCQVGVETERNLTLLRRSYHLATRVVRGNLRWRFLVRLHAVKYYPFESLAAVVSEFYRGSPPKDLGLPLQHLSNSLRVWRKGLGLALSRLENQLGCLGLVQNR